MQLLHLGGGSAVHPGLESGSGRRLGSDGAVHLRQRLLQAGERAAGGADRRLEGAQPLLCRCLEVLLLRDLAQPLQVVEPVLLGFRILGL